MNESSEDLALADAEAKASRAALSAPAVPPGFVLVPVEPTPEMYSVGYMHLGRPSNVIRSVYTAMLASALSAPAVPPEEVMDMALCEASSLVLRIGQLYRFRPVGACQRCKALAAQARDAYGDSGDPHAAAPSAKGQQT